MSKRAGKTRELYRFIWSTSARDQMALIALSTGVFLLELAPLELQRRIVNAAVDHREYRVIALLCGVYLAVSLLHADELRKVELHIYTPSVPIGISGRTPEGLPFDLLLMPLS